MKKVENIEALISKYSAAVKAHQPVKAKKLRQKLTRLSVVLTETPDGIRWQIGLSVIT